jgi:hypothetical protein
LFSFSLRNLSEHNSYLLFSPSCTISVSGKTIFELYVLPTDLGTWTQSVPSEIVGGFYPDFRLAQFTPGRSTSFTRSAPITQDIIQTFEEIFETLGRGSSISLDVDIKITVMEKDRNHVTQRTILCRYHFFHSVESNRWISWMRDWGYRMRLMVLPEELYARIHETMRKSGHVKEWEVLSEALYSYVKNASNPSTVVKHNSSSKTDLKDTIGELIRNSKKRLFIAVQNFDNIYTNEIINAYERGVDVKLIVGMFEKKWLHGRDRRGVAFLTSSKKGIRA